MYDRSWLLLPVPVADAIYFLAFNVFCVTGGVLKYDARVVRQKQQQQQRLFDAGHTSADDGADQDETLVVRVHARVVRQCTQTDRWAGGWSRIVGGGHHVVGGDASELV